MGRVSTGVRGMNLDAGDEVIGLVTIKPDDTQDSILVLSQHGFGKRSQLNAYRLTNRGAKGVATMKVTDRTGELVAFTNVNDGNDLVIINKSGITLRVHVADIRVMGRMTQGVRIINLEKRGDTIASVCCVDADPEEEVVEVNAEAEPLPDLGLDETETDEIEEELPEDEDDGAEEPENDNE